MPDPRADLTVAVFPAPGPNGDNPYLARLHTALQERGVHVVPGWQLTPRWAREARGRVDVVHLHWLEYVVYFAGRGLEHFTRTHLRVGRYALALRQLRSMGIRTVWTVHNRRPHERQYPWLDEFVVRYTAEHSDALVFHSQAAAERLADDMRRPFHAWVAPHPNYRDSYPPDRRSRREQRAAFGLDESAFVYLIFGQIREYKRVPEAIRAFRDLPDPSARLLVAGAPLDDRIAAQVRREADRDRRVVPLLRRIADDEVSALFGLADAAVLNHDEVFSSGALLLALSYGLPVVAPERGSARDVVAAPALESFAPGHLTPALDAIRSGDPSLRRGAALQAVAPFTYDRLADEVLRAYRGEGGTSISPGGRSAG